jgi:hypothetical protein
MPLENPGLRGTESDGSGNHEYCIYCYRDGAFVKPDITLDDMRRLVKQQMEKRRMNAGIINMTQNFLPGLKRWKENSMSSCSG